MTAAELAARHPRLYHLTDPAAWSSIRRHGLLSAAALAEFFDLPPSERERLLGRRRATAVELRHPRQGRAVLGDNRPLSERALGRCLDDGLAPADWLRLLDARVFFWASREGLARLLEARTNRERPRLVLELDTRSLAAAHAETLCLSPINSGATLRRPARRGLATFTPLARHDYAGWSRLRGRRDRVLEVTVDTAVPDVERHLVALHRDARATAFGT